MGVLLETIWPLFALIVLGFGLKRWGFPGDAFWPAADRLNYFVLFPALLVVSLSHAPLHDPALGRLALAILVSIGLASLGFLVVRRLRGWKPARYGPLLQAAIRFNTYLGLAIVGGLHGASGLAIAAVVIAILVPTVNVLSVIALTADEGVEPQRILASLVANPLIGASLFGIALAAFGFDHGPGLPFGAGQFLTVLSSASLPLGLLSVGAALKLEAARAETATLAASSAVRLLIMPGLGFLIASAFGLAGGERAVMVIFFALPTATSAYVLTSQLRGDVELMAGLVTAQTLLSAASLPIVLAVLN